MCNNEEFANVTDDRWIYVPWTTPKTSKLHENIDAIEIEKFFLPKTWDVFNSTIIKTIFALSTKSDLYENTITTD